MNKLPEFKPLPDVDNLRSNYMSAFNHGMNIYEALVYLQGYVQITYNSMDDLINDWNNFEQYVTDNISQIANEKTQEILNQWLSDGTLNELIAQNPLWNQKVSKSGDIMSGDLQFQENKGVYGTLHSGDKVNMISHSYTGSDDYTQIGDSESQAVVRSKDRPVWYNGTKNQDLIVEDDLNNINTTITNLQENAEKSVYWNENGSYDTLQDYDGNHKTKFLKPSDIIDNLTSTSTDKALSAKQGKLLNDTINSYLGNDSSKIVNTGVKWIDGKPLYRIFINMQISTQSFNVAQELSSLGVTDVDSIMFDFSKSYINYGSSLSNLSGFQPLSIYLGGNDSKGVFVDGEKRIVIRGSVPTTEVMYAKAVICLLFTKTTDSGD